MLLVWLAMAAPGCSLWNIDNPVQYETVQADPHRDTDLAVEKHQRAIRLIERDQLERAEKLLHEALVADVTFGPAHNNLGKLYYQQHKLYLAAWEFEYATRLMPNRAEPLNNLGLVYETVGKINEAVEVFEIAHGIEPQNPEYLGNLCRARLQRGDQDDQTNDLLAELLMVDSRPQWLAWARERLALHGDRYAESTPSVTPPLSQPTQPDNTLLAPEELPFPTPSPAVPPLPELHPPSTMFQ